ncbi:RseA family anti-sigma factor [Kangiella marina]|uniref:Anti sigma-E protein RseA N-terminal domain-containing protein n=1 Tax=Kangiella marina TaxID=1079178 RepID=A0ABP8IMQ1_9GAMM
MSKTKHFDKEILSAWVDGKADQDGQEPSLEQGSESMATWSRYHVIGQVMRDEAQHLDLDISAKVSQAVAQEETHSVAEVTDEVADNVIPFPSRVWKQAGGLAIAASVAIVALFSVSNTQPTAPSTLSTFAATDTQTSGSTLNDPVSVASTAEADRQELQTMHDMFLKHEALSRKITGASSLPTVRVVSNQKVIPVQVPMRVQDESQTSEASDQE